MPVRMKGSPNSRPRDEMGAMRDAIAAKNRERIAEDNKKYQEMLTTTTRIDDRRVTSTRARRGRGMTTPRMPMMTTSRDAR